VHEQPEEAAARADFIQKQILPAMERARRAADRLEQTVAADLWPLPRYSELMFLSSAPCPGTRAPGA